MSKVDDDSKEKKKTSLLDMRESLDKKKSKGDSKGDYLKVKDNDDGDESVDIDDDEFEK